MQYASVVARMTQRGANKPETHEHHGRVRLTLLDTTFSDDDMKACIARFPAGRIRLLSMSVMGVETETKDASLSVGISAHQDFKRLWVKEDPEAMLKPTSVSTVAKGVRLAPVLSGVLVESVQGFDIVLTSTEKLAKGDKVTGVIYYVAD